LPKRTLNDTKSTKSDDCRAVIDLLNKVLVAIFKKRKNKWNKINKDGEKKEKKKKRAYKSNL